MNGNPHVRPKGALTAHRESSDAYHRVVVRLSQRWRVIVCRDGIQWIVQRRVAAGRRGGEWKGVHYCRTRDALIRLCDASCRVTDPTQWAMLLALPAQFGTGW